MIRNNVAVMITEKNYFWPKCHDAISFSKLEYVDNLYSWDHGVIIA